MGRQLLLLTIGLLLASCSRPEPGSGAGSAISPASLEPADPALAEVYNRSCRSCHAQGAAQAPLTGDATAWGPRLDQGMETLLNHTINGYQGMPPMGMCFDCSEVQFEALIRFMGRGEG